MDEIYCLKFVIACCEESIKEVLKVRENLFSVDLFGVLLKKNVYGSLEGDDWMENVRQMVERMSISYDFVDELEGDESLEEKIEIDFEKLKNMSESEREELVENIDLEELMGNTDEVEVSIEIPIGSIVEQLRRMMGEGVIELDYNPREILRDINIMDEIWDSWNPYDNFMITAKSMVDYVILTL